jgi:hypothetical protein
MANASNRITHVLLALVLLSLFAMIGMLATTARGGPLDPPGPVGTTDGLRGPGTPISSLPFTIDQPGYYYLTRNLTGAQNTDGITVSASDVTLDLGGFELAGTNRTGDGISVSGTQRAVVVRNGSVTNWDIGIFAAAAVYSRVHDVTVLQNAEGLRIGIASMVEDCVVSSNLGIGIRANTSIIRDCTIIDNNLSGVEAFNESYIHHNHIFNNNVSSTYEHSDVRLTGTRNTVEQNQGLGVAMTTSSTLNRVYRNRGCDEILDLGSGNEAPVIPYEPMGNGQYGIKPERNRC